MFKSVSTLKNSLKNKPVAMVQEDDQLIITNTKTNQALFVMKLFNNGTTVNIKKGEFDTLQAIPAEKTRTITLFRLTHKIFRINVCQGKTVIIMNTVDDKVKIKNTINNTEYEADVVEDVVTLNESDYKAIRNPQVIDETGKPVPLKDVIKQNNPNFGTKRVKKVVETSRVMPVEALKRKINRINEINEDVLIILNKKYKGYVKVVNALVEPAEIFKMEVKEIDKVNCVEIPIEHYKNIRNPQHFDADGKEITLTQYLKSKPKKERKLRVRKEKTVLFKTIDFEALKRKIDRINEINEDTLIILHRPFKGFVKVTNSLVEPVEIFKMKLEKIDNVDCVSIPVKKYKNIKHPQHFDADGKEITLAQYLKSKPKKEHKPRVTKAVVEAKPVVYKEISVPDDLLVQTTPQKICLRCVRINRIEKAEVMKFDYDKTNQLITVENTLNNTRYVLRVVDKVVLITKHDMDAIKLPVHRDADGKRIKIADRK